MFILNRNLRVTVLINLIFITGGFCFAYFFFGQKLVEDIYYRKSLPFLNQLVTGQAKFPLDFYIKRANYLFLDSIALIILFNLLIFFMFFKMPVISHWFRTFFQIVEIKDLLKSVKHLLNANKTVVLLAAFIFVGSLACYFMFAFFLSKANEFHINNFLFGLDTERSISDIANFLGDHWRTRVHPIYVLLVNPGGVFLSAIVGSGVVASILINSGISALNGVFAFIFFWYLSKNYLNSFILSIIFTLSMSQIILGSIPGTASLATLSLLLTYILFLHSVKNKRLHLTLWFLLGVLSLGITTTNFIQIFVCALITMFMVLEKKHILKTLAAYVIIVSVTTITLSIIQKAIYPSSNLFFFPSVYAKEVNLYTGLSIFNDPLRVILEIIKHFFLVNVIAPLPNVVPSKYHTVSFIQSWNYLSVGWCGVFLWVLALMFGIVRTILYKHNNPFYVGIFLCLLFNIFFHSFYGVSELILFSGHFTFLVLILICPLIQVKGAWSRLILIPFAILMGINNIHVMKYIIKVILTN